MPILIGQTGLIVEGEDAGSYAEVIDESESTGGLLILISRFSDMSSAHDSWVADEAALADYFNESGGVTEWLSVPSVH